MSEAFLQNLLYIAFGWLLATATQFLSSFGNRYTDTRRLFTKLHHVLSGILIEMEVNEAGKELGLIQTVGGVFDLDESWTERLRPRPPSLPEDFNGLVAELSDWEARRGGDRITISLQGIASLLNNANGYYEMLSQIARDPGAQLPDRRQKFIDDEVLQVKKSAHELMKNHSWRRLSWPRQIQDRLARWKRLGS